MKKVRVKIKCNITGGAIVILCVLASQTLEGKFLVIYLVLLGIVSCKVFFDLEEFVRECCLSKSKKSSVSMREKEKIQERKITLTPCHFSSAMGLNPFKTREQLWLEMTGRVCVQKEPNAAQMYGIVHEKDALELYLQSELLFDAELEIKAKVSKTHPKLTWFRGICDGLVFVQGKLVRILEIKCRTSSDLKSVVYPHQTLDQILHFLPQSFGYLELFDCPQIDLLSYTARGSILFRIERNSLIWNDFILPSLLDFLSYVHDDTVPPPPLSDTQRDHLVRSFLTLTCVSYPWEELSL